MKASTVNISFNDELLQQIDQIAREESRSRSELIREAARGYIDRKRRWKQILSFAEQKVRMSSLSEDDIQKEITAYRNEKRKSKA